MTPLRSWPLAFLFLAVACTVESPPLETDCTTCSPSTENDFSFLTLHRSWGPDVDKAPWRFTVDELTCTLTPASTNADPAAVVATCSVTGQPDDATVPLFVNAHTTGGGFGRVFRVDTLGRTSSHIRVEREGVLIDELDHTPTFTTVGECGSLRYDLGGVRELPQMP